METIYNFYLYFDLADRCERVGYVTYELTGDDEEGRRLLQKHLKGDLQHATKVKLSSSFTRHEFNARCRLGNERELLAEAMAHAGAAEGSLALITPVVNRQVKFNHAAVSGQFDVDDAAEAAGEHGVMVDWLRKYSTQDGFRFTDLIHDDYFIAIKLTYNGGLFVSSMKLLLSCIDSLAYVEFGDLREPPSFVRWLSEYVDLLPLGITAEELWELRNGLLHMSNINSSKVRQRNVRCVSFRVGPSQVKLPDTGSTFYFEFIGLINALSQGLERWARSYELDREKFVTFVERYDETVSDIRVAAIQIKS